MNCNCVVQSACSGSSDIASSLICSCSLFVGYAVGDRVGGVRGGVGGGGGVGDGGNVGCCVGLDDPLSWMEPKSFFKSELIFQLPAKGGTGVGVISRRRAAVFGVDWEPRSVFPGLLVCGLIRWAAVRARSCAFNRSFSALSLANSLYVDRFDFCCLGLGVGNGVATAIGLITRSNTVGCLVGWGVPKSSVREST